MEVQYNPQTDTLTIRLRDERIKESEDTKATDGSREAAKGAKEAEWQAPCFSAVNRWEQDGESLGAATGDFATKNTKATDESREAAKGAKEAEWQAPCFSAVNRWEQVSGRRY